MTLTNNNQINRQVLYVLGILFCISGPLLGQDTIEESEQLLISSQVIPPSPTAAALAKYGDIPVSYNNGLPNINIPIHTATSGSLSLPVSLSYHASGLKVQEEAPWVGFGFSLNAGGVITRTLHGLPDESIYGYYNNRDLIDDIANKVVEGRDLSDEDEMKFVNIHRGELDSEPDEYYYNFNGRSGQLLLTAGVANFETIPYSPLKVETSIFSGGSTFTITDENGVKYTFSALEKGEYNKPFLGPDPGEDPIPYTQAWYLTQIVSANQRDTITLEYTPSYIIEDSHRRVFYQTLKLRSTNIGECPPTKNIHVLAPKRVKRELIKLTKITYNNGEMRFISTNDRTDIPGEYKLDAVEIYSLGQLKKTYAFGYGEQGRLQLETITEIGTNGLSKPPHRFQYWSGSVGISIYSNAMDHWGYYNGANNSHLIPAGQSSIPYEGANREPSDKIEHARTGMLKKITYPTGGYTEFEYEINTYTDVTVLESEIIETQPRTISPSSIGWEWTSTGENVELEQELYNDRSLEILAPQTVDIRILLGSANDDEEGLFPDMGEDWPLLQFSIYNLDTQSEDIVYTTGNEGEINRVLNFERHLSIGNYNIIAKVLRQEWVPYTRSILNSYWGKISVTYLPQEVNNCDNALIASQKPAGGIRIAKIRDIDPFGNPEKVRTFDYSKYFNVNECRVRGSSGKITNIPSYRSIYTDAFETGICAPRLCTYTMITAYNNTSGGGNPTAYTHVTVNYGENGENGRTEYTYSRPSVSTNGFPFVPSNPIKRSRSNLLLKTADFNNDNSIVREVTNDYTFRNTDPDEPHYVRKLGLKVGIETNDLSCRRPNTQGLGFLSFAYLISTEWFYLSSTTENVYYSTGIVTTTTAFNYDNPEHAQLTRKVTSNSDGTTTYIKIKYPLDYAYGADPLLNPHEALVNVHVLTTPVEQQVWRDDRMISGRITTYDPNLFLPSHLYLFESDQPISSLNNEVVSGTKYTTLMSDTEKFKFRSEFNYDSYRGNLVSQKVDEFSTAYHWGYNQHLPIAQAVNATNNEIFYTGFEDPDEGNSLDGDSKTGLKSKINGYAKILTNLSSGEYLLSWWEKQSGQWQKKEQHLSITTSSYTISLGGQVDEVRFHPIDAQMTTYTYDPLFGLTEVVDPNHQSIYYIYDEQGRLSKILDQDRQVIESTTYQYFQNQD